MRTELLCAKNLSTGLSNQLGKIDLTVDQFFWCLALYETPVNVSGKQDQKNELPLIHNSVA